MSLFKSLEGVHLLDNVSASVFFRAGLAHVPAAVGQLGENQPGASFHPLRCL